MITTCIQSVFLSIFIWIAIGKLLLFIALNNSKGEIETMLQLMIVFDIVMFLSLPLLLMMTKNIC